MKVSAPGKLFIAGEWAILEPKNFGIVAAINKRIFVKISPIRNAIPNGARKSPDKNIYITLKDFGLNNLKVNFSKGELKFFKKLTKKERKIIVFSKTAIETSLRYLENWKPFQIKIWGKETKKIGFGFSAASTVAVVAALLAFHKKNFKKEELFKLSALSHYLAQGKIGSGFDIAASTFGGIFVYRRFNPVWLKNQIEREKDIRKIIKKPWRNFYFKKLNLPENLQLLIGWTGKSALTPELIKMARKWKEKNQSEYKRLISGIGKLVKELINAWRLGKKEKILDLIKKNEIYLRELGEKSGVDIETKKLRKLAEVAEKFGGAGKLSGSGGGDCGIAITFDKKTGNRIKKEWGKNNILPINTKINFSGVKLV